VSKPTTADVTQNSLVRPYHSGDAEAFRKIHADSKLAYDFPNLDSPLFIVKTVVERAGRSTTLLAGRIECESYLMTSGNAAERLQDIEAAQKQFLHELWLQGIDNTYCMVPRSVDRHFGKHMQRLGWQRGRSDWHPWNRLTVSLPTPALTAHTTTLQPLLKVNHAVSSESSKSDIQFSNR
jgi:hypothetical protein